MIAIAWVIGDNLRTRRAYLSELKERAARLEREREEKADRAVVEERVRIARELHDVIAHNVSVMVVQAAAGEEVFDQDPERARESLSAVASTGRAALTELRRLLGVIRADGRSRRAVVRTPAGDRVRGRARPPGERRGTAGRAVGDRRAAPAARGRRPVRLPDRAGGPHQHAQARRGIGRPGQRALRRRRARAPGRRRRARRLSGKRRGRRPRADRDARARGAVRRRADDVRAAPGAGTRSGHGCRSRSAS